MMIKFSWKVRPRMLTTTTKSLNSQGGINSRMMVTMSIILRRLKMRFRSKVTSRTSSNVLTSTSKSFSWWWKETKMASRKINFISNRKTFSITICNVLLNSVSNSIQLILLCRLLLMNIRGNRFMLRRSTQSIWNTSWMIYGPSSASSQLIQKTQASLS